LHLGKTAGLDEGYIKAFEQLHFWVNYAAFGILSLDLLWRIWRAAFKKEEQR
jgi:cytochrome b